MSLYWCLIQSIDWRYSQLCRYFQPLLWTVAPLPSLWPPHPFPPSQMYSEYTDSVWLWGWGGVELCGVVYHILQEFNTLFLTRFRTYKIATPPQGKTPVKTTFWDRCLYSSFFHASTPPHPPILQWPLAKVKQGCMSIRTPVPAKSVLSQIRIISRLFIQF
jgi:hypothetical protein